MRDDSARPSPSIAAGSPWWRRTRDQQLLASLLASIAELKVVQGQFAEAESLARRSFSVFRQYKDRWTPAQAASQAHSQAVGQSALGEALRRQGKASESVEAFVAALKLAEGASAPPPRLLPILHRAAGFYREHGR